VFETFKLKATFLSRKLARRVVDMVLW